MIETFIKRTAKDYDMSIEDVKRIYDESDNKVATFYGKLEEFTRNRAERNNEK